MTQPPVPDAAARAHSARVVAHIRAAIDAAGGYLPFDRYMDLALYAPGLGYYAAGAAKIGTAGDFVTAPELTPLFATALATQVAEILAGTGRREIIELGGGSGRMAVDLLRALSACDALPSRYAILDVSPDLRERQRSLLGRHAPTHVHRVVWLDAPPDTIDGAVIANEVLDALPVQIAVRHGGAWLERGVTWDATNAKFAWAERPADRQLAALAAARFPACDGYSSEINLRAESLVEDLARRLAVGAALFVDYGFPAAEYYHPQRNRGTLMCHYRHHAHDDPFAWPGLTDITAHVDFSALAAAGERAGLEVAGYATQASFLIGCGILDALAATGSPDSLAYMTAAAPVQKLLAPAEMGELFKVLAMARSPAIAWPGFGVADHRHRL